MTSARWLNDSESAAWRGMLTMHRRILQRTARHLQRDSGISGPDYEVLVSLSEADQGRLRAYELGDVTQWEKSRLFHHITRMTDRGLVTRESGAGRSTYIRLTPQGWAVIEAAAPMHVADVREAFVDALTTTQLQSLAEISAVVLEHLAALDEAEGCQDAAQACADEARDGAGAATGGDDCEEVIAAR